MVKISGKYKLYKNENFVELLTAWGIPKEKINELSEEYPTVTVLLEGKNLIIGSDSKINHTSKLILDEEVEEIVSGRSHKTTAKQKNDTLFISTKFTSGNISNRTYKFFDDELIVTLTKEGAPEAIRYYKRLE